MDEMIVAVSGINAIDNPGPGVGVARSLKEDNDLNVRIVGLAYDAMDPGIYMDWVVDKSYIMPYPTGGFEALIKRLQYIKETYGLDAVIPTLDVEFPFYTKHARDIEELGIRVFVPTDEQFRWRAKDQLASFVERIGLQIPPTRVVSSYGELTQAVSEIGLPVMVKGAYYKAYAAYTLEEAVAHFNRIVAEWGYPILLQKIVAGDEMNVIGVGDGEGGHLGLVGIKKTLVTAQGKIWTGVTVTNSHMLTAAEKFVATSKWRGAFELECIVHENDVFLIEINPRFPAWSYFATGVGVNLASNMLRKMFGLPQTSSNPEYEAGKLYVRYTYEVVTDMHAFQNIITKGES